MHHFKENFNKRIKHLFICLTLLISTQLIAATQEQKLIASDPAMTAYFGTSVSVSGDTAVAGANGVLEQGNAHGAAYVFEYDGTNWVESIKLSPADDFEAFGISVSISGDRIAVGASTAFVNSFASAGVVYIYEKNVSGDWVEVARLFASDNERYDKFGSSVSLDGDRLIVGVPSSDDVASNSGSAYIFDFDGNTWNETAKLTASNPVSSDLFGTRVDIDGDRAIVSSPYSDDVNAGSSVGSTYVFEKSNSTWSETTILSASDLAENDNFGNDISLSGNWIVIGSQGNDDTASNTGSAYLFNYDTLSMTWDAGLKINANDAEIGDRFGSSVEIDGNKILIGATNNDDLDNVSGSVYSYYYNGSSWNFIKLILHTDSERFTDKFGNAIGLDGNRSIIGSYNDDSSEGQTYNSGAAYIFDVDESPEAVMDTTTVNEDIFSTNVDVLINDTDSDAGPKFVTEITQPNYGSTTIAFSGTIVKYFPNDDYCNDGITTDDFTYTLNGGSTATVKVTVNCIDDAPVAVADTNTIIEDLGVTYIRVLDNDTDIDDGPMVVESFTQAVHGLVGTFGPSLSYSPDSNYCNDGNTTDDFTYTLNGGSQTTVSITVNCVDDSPEAIIDDFTLNEDSGTTILTVLNNDTDIDDGSKIIIDISQPSNGIVVNNTSDVSYTPNANYCNDGNTTDDFTYTLNGDSQTTVSVTVNCVNDSPSFDITGDINLNPDQLNSQNQWSIEDFASNINFGPSNESSQQVSQYIVTENSDSMNIINNIEMSNDGILSIDFSLNPGMAIINISMQDNGGTEHGGIDTSVVYTFNVSITDIVFSDGFETIDEFFITDYINEINTNNPNNEQLIYDYASDSIFAKGLMLEMFHELSISQQKQRIQSWIKEILFNNQ